MEPLAIDCIVPAAGLSSRMGSHKLLEPFGDHPLVYWAVHHAAAACRRVIVVLGHNAEGLQAVLPQNERIEVTTNDNYREGMITSIAQGTTRVRTDCFFVAPADMPFLVPGIFRAVAAAAGYPWDSGSESPEESITLPTAWYPHFRGMHGHPALIRSAVVPELGRLVADSMQAGLPPGSMRSFLSGYTTSTVAVDDDGSIVDIDTKEALLQHSDRARQLQG